MNRFVGCAGMALLACMFAKAIGVPVWLHGFDFGDQTDFAVIAFYTSWCFTRPRDAHR